MTDQQRIESIDAALIAQSRFIRDILAQAKEPNACFHIGKALDLLEFNRDLWIACSYGYKGKELVIECIFILDNTQSTSIDYGNASNYNPRAKYNGLASERLYKRCHKLRQTFHESQIV